MRFGARACRTSRETASKTTKSESNLLILEREAETAIGCNLKRETNQNGRSRDVVPPAVFSGRLSQKRPNAPSPRSLDASNERISAVAVSESSCPRPQKTNQAAERIAMRDRRISASDLHSSEMLNDLHLYLLPEKCSRQIHRDSR